MKTTAHYDDQPQKAPHLYDQKLSVKNWRKVYRTKYAPFMGKQAAHVEQFIERLLLNTIKQARRGNLDEMFDAV